MAENLQTILQTRAQSHGDFRHVATTSQNLKRAMNCLPAWNDLEFWQQEALEQMCMKMARIMSGNSLEIDHWHDIAGYASLVVREIERHQLEYELEAGVKQVAETAARQHPSMHAMIRELPDEVGIHNGHSSQDR